jgi:phosphohistidine phosphatase
MKTLHLLRHAKASRDDASGSDHDRPLADRGRADAPRMAERMARAGVRPDLVAVSSALRARETWDLAAPFLATGRVEIVPELYLCGISDLLTHVRAFPEDVGQVLIVGHNPDLEELALHLAGDAADPVDLARIADKFPTCAWADLRLRVDRWVQAGRGCATLARLICPRDLPG